MKTIEKFGWVSSEMLNGVGSEVGGCDTALGGPLGLAQKAIFDPTEIPKISILELFPKEILKFWKIRERWRWAENIGLTPSTRCPL